MTQTFILRPEQNTLNHLDMNRWQCFRDILTRDQCSERFGPELRNTLVKKRKKEKKAKPTSWPSSAAVFRTDVIVFGCSCRHKIKRFRGARCLFNCRLDVVNDKQKPVGSSAHRWPMRALLLFISLAHFLITKSFYTTTTALSCRCGQRL